MRALREKLLQEIGAQLKPEGFRKSEQTFGKDFDGGRLFFHLAFIPHAADFDVTADVAVRHEAVEHARHADNRLISDREKKKTATVGAELGNLLGTGQHRWTVRDEQDIPLVVTSILKMFRHIGCPFLERYSSLSETRRVLAEDTALSRLICPIADVRARIVEIISEVRK
jgi:hypothetical protein